MFTGIIESVGTVARIERAEQKARLVIEAGDEYRDFEAGESVAVNGVCLTVREPSKTRFSVDLTTETLSRTSFANAVEGTRVNLERSLTPSKKMSGHFVTGHIDQMGKVALIDHRPGEVLMRFEHPEDLAPFIIEKGSIAIDGISLTVFDCDGKAFSVSIIPFTWEHTNLNQRKVGEAVNIECDMIGKYVVNTCRVLLKKEDANPGLTLDLLKQQGIV